MKIIIYILTLCLLFGGLQTINTINATITISAYYPSNNTVNVCPPAYIGATISVDNGKPLNLTFYSNLSGIWDYFYMGTINTTYTNATNGTYQFDTVFMIDYGNTYYWYINATEYENESNYTVSPIYNLAIDSSPANCTSNGSNISYSWVIGIAIVFSSLGILAFIRKKDIVPKRKRKDENNE